MPKIVTQGISLDYQVATGSYDDLERGDLNRDEILHILNNAVNLLTQEDDCGCPPVVIAENDIPILVYVDNGSLHCDQTEVESVMPEEAVSLMCMEMTFSEFNRLKFEELMPQDSLQHDVDFESEFTADMVAQEAYDRQYEESYRGTELYSIEKEIADKLGQLDPLVDYSEILSLKIDLLKLIPIKQIYNITFFREEIDTHELNYLLTTDDWFGFYEKTKQRLRDCVALQDRENFNKIKSMLDEFQSSYLSGNLDVGQVQLERFYNDIDNAKKIYQFIYDQPGILQGKTYKVLGLDGRNSAYIFTYAEKYRKLRRVKVKNGWEVYPF